MIEEARDHQLLFDKLLEPISEPLKQLDQHPISQAAKKLMYAAFVRVLLFRVFDQIRSLRDLTLDLKTKSEARLLNLPMVGLSTLHDGFARYPVEWLIGLIQRLTANYPLAEIEELKALGEVWTADSSYWPVVNQLGWLARQGLQGVRLHLGLSLNTMCVAAFAADLRCRLEFIGKGLPAGDGASRRDLCDGSRLCQHRLLP